MSPISVEHAENQIKRLIGPNGERQEIFDFVCERTRPLGEGVYKNMLGIILSAHGRMLYETMTDQMGMSTTGSAKYKKEREKLQRRYDKLVASDYVEYLSDIVFRDAGELDDCIHQRPKFECQRDYDRVSNILFTEQQQDLLKYDSVRINLEWSKREYADLLEKGLDKFCPPTFKPTPDPENDTAPESRKRGGQETPWIKDFQKDVVDLLKNNGLNLAQSLETVNGILKAVFGKYEAFSTTEKRQQRM